MKSTEELWIRETRGGGAGGDIHGFVLTKTKIKW